uniref:ABC transporter domain-containing protein n=1 Tax=Macrostomum lignano TaxID=282301 RepID=A0A1I8HI41_9PLAT
HLQRSRHIYSAPTCKLNFRFKPTNTNTKLRRVDGLEAQFNQTFLPSDVRIYRLKMAIGTLEQTNQLLMLMLHMKRWKFIWFIIVFLSAISNHMLFPIIDGWMGTLGQVYTSIDTKRFVESNLILAETYKYERQLESLKSILDSENVRDSGSLIETCSSPKACKARMFSVMFGRVDTSKFSNFVTYNYSNRPRVECQMSYGGDLNCPYLGNLAVMSSYPNKWKNYMYKEIHFFSLTSRKEGKKTDSVRGNTTKCAKHENFETVFSRTVMMQCVIIIGSMSFYFLVSTQSCIAQLKRDGFLQLMMQKGLSVSAYWLVISAMTAIEIVSFSIIFVTSLAVQCPGFFNPVHMLLVFLMSLFYMVALTSVGLLLTVTFGNYYYVGLMTVLIAIISMVLVLVNRMAISTIVVLKIILLFIFPLGHFAEFVQGILLSEIRMESISIYNISILVVTLLSAVVLVLSTLVLDYVSGSGNGFRLPAQFFIRREFWTAQPASKELGPEKDDPLYGEEPPEYANIEPVTDGLRPLVRMSHLSKAFQARKACGKSETFYAVKDMSAMVYENHITAIIGHNGAGKTTLLNLLTGADTPTTGHASICGIVGTNPLKRLRLRGHLGICPQIMNFASSITVEQTLQLLVISCGLQWNECQEELTRMLKVARLDNKRHYRTGRLSAGQQRKLAVIMALMGNPRVLFLDEPTSGLDPESRRRMWRLLQEYRHGRAILISTQFMDEADTLADRKIFISSGALLCAGSSLFLKSAFDCGFVFEVTLKNEKHSKLVKKQILEEFKMVKVKKSFGVNLNFQLPARDINFLPALAQAFEKRMTLVSAFGLLQASLYDIFMKLKDLDPEAVQEMFSEDKENAEGFEDEQEETFSEASTDRNTKLSCIVTREHAPLAPSLLRQLKAMIIVNVMRLVRTRMRLACRVIVPAILLIVLIITAAIERSNNNHRIHLRNNMTNEGEIIKHGVCVFEKVEGKPRMLWEVDKRRCSWLYAGKTAPMEIAKNYLALQKPKEVELQNFLREKSNIEKIQKYATVYSLSTLLLLSIVQTGYSSSFFMTGVFLPILLLGLPSNQLMTYVLSTILDRANHLVTIMYLFTSILLAFIVLLVQLNNVASIILISVLPPFAPIALTFYGVKTIFYSLSYYNKDSISDITELKGSLFFSQPHVVAAFIAIILHFAVLLTALAIIENKIILLQLLEARLQIKCTSELPVGTFDNLTEDPGVKEETERIDANPNSEMNLLEVSHLAKTYPNGTKVVRDISFATGPAEIFGILGPNGAGKTTALSTIVGRLNATRGRCEVRRQDEWLPSGLATSRGAIGYCPQSDPLYGCITAMEHLKFYANIIGVPDSKLDSLIEELADSLDLNLDRESLAEHLSVGIRRRLSLAISLLSEPSVLVIDEATTGVDPEGKRFLWQAIRAAATLTCTVLVTTHSMEEVEAICNRVTIINRGLLVGLGTVQQLKSLYGRSYSLEILLNTSVDEAEDSVEAKMATLIEAVSKKFKDTKVVEEFHDRVHLAIPVGSVSRLSVALSWLLENRKSLNIYYFSLHQMSMDQVFERMVKHHDATIRQRTSIFSNVSHTSDNQSLV